MLNSQEQVDWSTQTQMILDWEAATTATSTWSGCSHQRVDRDAWLRTWQSAELPPQADLSGSKTHALKKTPVMQFSGC